MAVAFSPVCFGDEPEAPAVADAPAAPVIETAAAERARWAGSFGLNLGGADLGVGYTSGRRTGFLVGPQIEAPLSGANYLQVDVLYYEAGYTQLISGTEYDVRVSQVKIPVLGKHKIVLGPNTRLSLGGGGYFAFKLNSQANGGGNTLDLNSVTAGTFFGLEALVGVEFFYKGDNAFFADVRYCHGLTNGATGAGSQAYGRDLNLSVGLRGSL